jgi:hypothetical protein
VPAAAQAMRSACDKLHSPTQLPGDRGRPKPTGTLAMVLATSIRGIILFLDARLVRLEEGQGPQLGAAARARTRFVVPAHQGRSAAARGLVVERVVFLALAALALLHTSRFLLLLLATRNESSSCARPGAAAAAGPAWGRGGEAQEEPPAGR